jgi:glycosyltransferase involved in cell wall biosynthesis
LPVVTTSIGNEGIEAVPDRDIFVADDPELFAEKVLLLLKNAQRWQEIAENGRIFVMKRYSLESVVNRIESGYELVLGGPVGLP